MHTAKWAFFILSIYPGVIEVYASSWTAQVPASVTGLQGSCVVIPCSFSYPEPTTKITEFIGIWMEQSEQTKIVYHPNDDQVMQEYRKRTELTGDLTKKNCSLKIDSLKLNDRKELYFRIEIKDYDGYSYKESKVSLSVISAPEPISFHVKEEAIAGETVSASCSLSYSCPSDPPAFSWSHSGEVTVTSEELSNGMWKLTSQLTFKATIADHDQLLGCNAKYRGGQETSNSTVLKVKYPPKIKVGSTCSADNSTIICVCLVESNPPSMVHFSLVDGTLRSAKVERHGFLTIGMLQGDLRSSNLVECFANNTHGNATLTLSIPRNDYMVVASVAIASGAFVVIGIFTAVRATRKCSRERPGDALASSMRDQHSARATGSRRESSAARKRNDRCVDKYFNPYTNEGVYTNEEAVCADGEAVYGNV
ncbi:sialic acid-binding Ig-like lectin 14 [Lampris incognitus]|uniref:sialic acid-binding Ig-like lectin 14 n=1 Tax=Lampris incognitus TaxID=2546036 RepID=UPI0024B5DD18|nr:sialic acid-binding Ig-like lectin 14 [Lampris incognitus]